MKLLGLCFHNWVYGEQIRKCTDCGKVQYAHPDYDARCYIYRNNPPECDRCYGAGKVADILDGASMIVTCPECDGSGNAIEVKP